MHFIKIQPRLWVDLTSGDNNYYNKNEVTEMDCTYCKIGCIDPCSKVPTLNSVREFIKLISKFEKFKPIGKCAAVKGTNNYAGRLS